VIRRNRLLHRQSTEQNSPVMMVKVLSWFLEMTACDSDDERRLSQLGARSAALQPRTRRQNLCKYSKDVRAMLFSLSMPANSPTNQMIFALASGSVVVSRFFANG
jgi:hypothetical protein